MSTVRVMHGLASMEGQKVNTLDVGEMVRRRPEPAYAVACTVCGSKSSATHTAIKTGTARCVAAGCGKATVKRDRRTDLAAEVARRESQRLADEQRLANARMDAEVADYKLPARIRPLEAPLIRSERDRLVLREHRAEVEATERAEREIREAPLRAAEKEFKETSRQLAEVTRERIAQGKDDEFSVDPDTFKPITASSVDAWQRGESAKFIAANPGYYACDENFRAISEYIERNAPGISLVSAKQLEAAYKRLRDYGLLKERPIPEPKPAPILPKRPAPPQPITYEGVDLDTGKPRVYSEREVSRMSSDEMKRKLRLTSATLALPNVGPGPGRK